MRSSYDKSASALLTALFSLLLSTVGCQEDPVTATDDAAPSQDQAETFQAGHANGNQIPFADAEVFFEFNTTDDDLGFQLALDAEGWDRVQLSGPGRDRLVQFAAQGNLAELGITELRFESAEPSPAEVLALFPPGEYKLTGRTVEGDRLMSTTTLSHDFAPAPVFSPSDGQVVDPDNTVVTWDAPGAEEVEVIIEGEDGTFDVTVPGEVTSLNVPPQFLDSDTEYKIEILAIAENGNRTIAESTFVTEP